MEDWGGTDGDGKGVGYEVLKMFADMVKVLGINNNGYVPIFVAVMVLPKLWNLG